MYAQIRGPIVPGGMGRSFMRIVELDEETKPLFCMCLEDWQDDVDMKEGARRRHLWVDRFTARGLRVKVALDDAGTPGGMIHTCRSRSRP